VFNVLTSKALSEVLRSNGYKVTPQRLAVYESLSKTKSHPNAETLFKALQPQFPTMSFATVYKSVEIFDKLHVIKVLNTGEDSFRYDADTSNHQHIQCVKCGRVDDISLDCTAMCDSAETKSGYKVSGEELYFYGLCPKCRAKESN
jgi:Fur family peroxide stress response transcriptional regulator